MNVAEADFPSHGSPQDKLGFALRYAMLAPSERNAQPRQFLLGPDYIDLLADHTRDLPALDPENRELVIGCGAALLNLRLALKRFGCLGRIEAFPDLGRPELLARIRYGGKRVRDRLELELFEAIPHRHTNRLQMESNPVDQATLFELKQALAAEHAWLEIASEGDMRRRLVDLIGLGQRTLQADSNVPAETAQWQHSPGRPVPDGIPSNATPGVVVKLTDSWFKTALRKFSKRETTKIEVVPRAQEAPILAVLKTRCDTPTAWLAAGQALEHLLLHAHLKGLSGSSYQPTQAGPMRDRLRNFGRKGYAQIILRLGRGPASTLTPRRSVDEVLV